MEDTKSLLIMVLQKIFEDRPKIIEDTFQLIYNYNNGKREKMEYKNTLKTICDMMNEELPSPMLVYLLTMVDMPSAGDGCQLPIMEKMQKTHNCIQESVRPHLLEYLKNKKPSVLAPPPVVESIIGKNKVECEQKRSEPVKRPAPPEDPPVEAQKTESSRVEEENFTKPAKKCRMKKKISKNSGDSADDFRDNPKSLLDLCAVFVVQNEKKLKCTFKHLQEKAWKMINTNLLHGESLQQCYTAMKDLNKKCKWLRMIENNNVTSDVLMEEYKDSDIFLKECHMYELVNRDPFVLSTSVIDYIDSLEKSFR